MEAELQRQATEKARQNIEWQKQQDRIAAEEKRLRAGGPANRISQGMKGVGSKFAPAMQGAAAGAGFAVSQAGVQTAKGLLAKPVNLLRNIIPENVMGYYVLLIMIVYWYSWLAGFAAPLVLASHSVLALIGFFLFVYVENSLEEGKGSLWQIVRRNGVTFSILLIIDYMLLTGNIQWTLVFIAALLLAFREGNPLEDLKRVVMVMLIAAAASAVAPFLYNQFNRLFFSALAKIALPFDFEVLSLNFSYLPFIVGLLANRTFTYPFFWFAIFGLSKKTRVARSLAWIIMFLFIFASWPNIAPEVSKLHGQYITGATPEQKAFWPNLAKQAGTNFKVTLTSLFQSFTVRTASAYEKTYGGLEQTFGFGEPKQQPKLGLALAQDNTMLKKYDLGFKQPEPSFVMRVTSPFPADAKKPYIEVTNINCYDKLKKLKFESVVTSKGVTPTEDGPVKVFYNGPDGGTLVRCTFSGWESGDYTIAAEVDYKVDSTAFLTTAFIRTDQDEALRLQGIDPAVVNKIPPATAKYDNMPVVLTWAPDLKKSPVSIEIREPSDANKLITGNVISKQEWDLLNTVYVSKNVGWENSEIKEVKSLTLTVPKGVKFVGDTCDFDLGKARTKEDGSTEYPLLGKKITKRFVGDAIRFDCGMKVSKEVLSGADWAPARFDVEGSFIFTTKLDSITFTVEGSEKDAATQAAQSGAEPTQPPASAPTAPPPPGIQV
ncbi:hypothetical protein HYU40_00920 [Candidatus Woesearchaeota archaeon]|nr:hypothetical protein [Candidatus Woesearchaeota archaeon]